MATSLAPWPAPGAVLQLLKPITWFPPMWAFGCGVVSSGVPPDRLWPLIALGIFLAGPMVCATSQAVNDWFDRHVDAINEPDRPIPSGRIPGRWGLNIAILWTALSFAVAALLGPWVLAAATFGLVLAWLYSAPPVRLKQNGWWGNAAVGLCYEGLPWIWAVQPRGPRHHDPQRLQVDARRCAHGRRVAAGAAGGAAGGLGGLRRHGAAAGSRCRPAARATWYSALGVNFYVLGMLVSAFAVGAMARGGA
ncbi:MAG: UbiA family prenyltransferase [Burkholderiaceae bacterium]|nr:UbiA family prenyltransferase [Burkholderiaceae bacterium]